MYRLTALYYLEDDNISMVKSVVRKVTNIIQNDIGRLESGIKSIERSDNVKLASNDYAAALSNTSFKIFQKKLQNS